jgi:hypothetical protein
MKSSLPIEMPVRGADRGRRRWDKSAPGSLPDVAKRLERCYSGTCEVLYENGVQFARDKAAGKEEMENDLT